MVECEECANWLHSECVGFPSSPPSEDYNDQKLSRQYVSLYKFLMGHNSLLIGHNTNNIFQFFFFRICINCIL